MDPLPNVALRAIGPEYRSGAYVAVLVDTERLKPTELVHEDRVRKLMTKIRKHGIWRVPILVEATVHAIMDGHHRYTAACRLGLRRVPAVVLAYGDPRLTLASWNGETYRPEDVIEAARTGRTMPQKSTRHILEPGLASVRVTLDALA
ncbi:MAG: ParB N-terminal domain-containing protein [Hyphomicrobiaceae bacterium]